jgi:hypothetical protein
MQVPVNKAAGVYAKHTLRPLQHKHGTVTGCSALGQAERCNQHHASSIVLKFNCTVHDQPTVSAV